MGELLGYADHLSIEPGQRLPVRVSSSVPDYRVETVRLIHADANPDGPGVREEPVDIPVEQLRHGRIQLARPGSCVVVSDFDAGDWGDGLTVQLWVLATRAACGSRQTLIGHWPSAGSAGFKLALTARGELELNIKAGGAPGTVCTDVTLPPEWCFVTATFDRGAGTIGLAWATRPDRRLTLRTAEFVAGADAAGVGVGVVPLSIGATVPANGAAPCECFDGRISNPSVIARGLRNHEIEALLGGTDPLDLGAESTLAAWDFGRDFSSTHVHDRSQHHHHGRTVNMAMRAVTGPSWSGQEVNFNRAGDEYAAIHFHSDDLADAGWELDLELAIPDELRSGVYAVQLRAGDLADDVPFVVRPKSGQATADTLLLLPTFTYLAYANERLLSGGEIDYGALTERTIEPGPEDAILAAHPELGLSLYDVHADGSGVCYSTAHRPILNMRPSYRMWLTGAPRHLAADLYIVDWLEAKHFAHDVATDGDLHERGGALLKEYAALVTGTHPEYWTERMRTALADYLDWGGRCLYLGGNGFYWVTSVTAGAPQVVEVRRGYAASRCWESRPGECYHSTTGELGGIWRHRGQTPNSLVGVGFIAQGSGRLAPGYVRCPDSYDPRVAFAFEGVAPDEVIGAFGLVMGGAAGDELDRFDASLGSPPDTLLLATSRGRHDDGYLLVHEEQLISELNIGGATNPKVGADMTYFENSAGGAVFAVGSINWAGSLSHANYDNNVSRITENVLRHFLRRAEPRA